MTRRSCHSFIQICASLVFITIAVANDPETCDKTKCPGPLAYYRDLNCIPVYKKEGDCCATKYNCVNLQGRSPTKCYVNGKEYEIGEELRDEDKNPCDHNCTCHIGYNEIASFRCTHEFCPLKPTQQGCYRKHSPSMCCPGEEVCPKNPEDRAICIVDGKEYRDGERFTVKSEPDLKCVCQPGYEGNNVEPFCAKLKHPLCSSDFFNGFVNINNCIPVSTDNTDQSSQTGCRFLFRCQEDNDIVIHNDQDISRSAEKNSNDEDVCYFGNMTMHRGDELNQTTPATSYSAVCIKCICEVPPVPTCHVLPRKGCEMLRRA